jgi:hypothetical protein
MPPAFAVRRRYAYSRTTRSTDGRAFGNAQARDDGPGNRTADRADPGAAQAITRRLTRTTANTGSSRQTCNKQNYILHDPSPHW